MFKHMTLNQLINRLSDSILALLLILNCHSVFERSVNINFHIYELTLVVIAVNIIVKCLNRQYSEGIFKRRLLLAIYYMLIVLVVLLMSVSPGDYEKFLLRFMIAPIILIYIALIDVYEDNGIFKSFVNWVCIITIVSLVFWIAGSIFRVVYPSGKILIDWGNQYKINTYYYLYYETQYADLLFGITDTGYRNTALFIEGPMYGLVLDVSLVFVYFFDKQIKYKPIKVLIILAGIISTFSSTAFLFSGFLFALYLFEKEKYRKLLLYCGLPVLLAVGILLIVKKSQTGSFSWRMDDYRAGLITWLQHPIFGAGYNNWEAINDNKQIIDNLGYSNAFFTILCHGGIVYAMIYFIPCIYCFASKGYKEKVLAIMYLFLLFTTAFNTTFINFYIWAILLQEKYINEIEISKLDCEEKKNVII